jgi:hypothetical protein
MEKKYYVYVYLDPRKRGEFIYDNYHFDYEPFYVGKGTGDRYLKHLCETSGTTCNIFKYRIVRKIYNDDSEPIILKIKEKLTSDEAYLLESSLIKLIGRRCDNTGCLTNIVTDGKPPSNYVKLSNYVIKEIIELYNKGWYLKHIGDKLGLAEMKIKTTLIENGINPKRKSPINKKKITDEQIKSMVFDYTTGLSIRKIMDKYLLSFETVRNTLKQNGVVFRGYNYKKSEEHIAKIFKNRVIKYGEENYSFKALSTEEILRLKDLRFNQKKTIKEILTLMKINQAKYYYYINI